MLLGLSSGFFICLYLSKEMTIFSRFSRPLRWTRIKYQNGGFGFWEKGHFAKFYGIFRIIIWTLHGRLVNVKHHIGRNFAPCISVHSFHSSSAYIVQARLWLSKLGGDISTYMLDRICPLVGIGLKWCQNLVGASPHVPLPTGAPACSDDDNESSFLASTVWCMRNVR